MSGLAGSGAVLASAVAAEEGTNAWTIVAWVVVGLAVLATAIGLKVWR